MTDVRVAFLSRLASSISNIDKSNKLLKSFYLMRCRQLINDPGLLQKYFPFEHTCSYCGIKWTKDDCVVNIKSKRLTKSQKRRTKASKEVAKNRKSLKKEKAVTISNLLSRGKQQVSHQKADGYLRPWRCQIVTSALPASYEGMGYLMEDWADEGGEDYWNTYEIQHLITQKEKVCQLCKHSTFINLIKPNVTENNKTRKSNMTESKQISKDITIKANNFIQNNRSNKTQEINVYSSTKDVFSLLNKNNSIIPNKLKVAKVNKRKKDKFAGLCKEAVLAMANSKKEKESTTKIDKLNLFLKPSN